MTAPSTIGGVTPSDAAVAVERLVGEYWSLAYAEGKEGRDCDTEDGAAGRCLHEIQSAVRGLAIDHAALVAEVERLKISLADEKTVSAHFRESCEIVSAEVERLEFEVSSLTAQVEHHTAYGIVHRGKLHYCNSSMRDAYSDEKVRADAAERALAEAREDAVTRVTLAMSQRSAPKAWISLARKAILSGDAARAAEGRG